ncbi:MAG TPA: hypothetical protein VF789_08965 [Thermoanaerobaculia bacterium]
MLRLRLRWAVLLSWTVLAALYPSTGQGQGVICTQRDDQLCFQGGRFVATVDWQIPGGRSGHGHAVPLTADTGLFWFFDNSNVELVLKVLDGRPANGHFWVYYGGLSDVAYTLTVFDLHTGAREVYRNRPGRLVSRSHTSAFLPEAPGIPTDTASLPSSRLLRQGSEFQSNVTSQGDQRSPAVALGPDGGFMVAWTDKNPETTLRDVFGRFYGPTGQPLTGEVRLRASINGDPPNARLAASRTGEYMAVWLDGPALFGRLFGADGTPLTGEIRIGAGPGSPFSPSVTADPAGGFLVAWVNVLGIPDSPWPIRWQRFDNQGQRVGLELGIERPSPGLPAVAGSPDGGFVLVWNEGAEVFGTDILALRLDETGVPLHSQALRVNTDDVRRYAGSHQFLTPLFHPDGDFSIVWGTSAFLPFPGAAGVYARRYDALGRPVTPVVALRTGLQGVDARPAAAALPSGESLVVWFEDGLIPDPDGGLYGQLFNSSWSPVGGASRVNTYTADQQTEAALAVDAGGGIVAAWSSGYEDIGILTPPGVGQGTQDGEFFGVFGQRFTLASCALNETQLCLGGRFRVEVQFTDPRTGQPGTARAVPLTSDTGAFWFFGDANAELVIKALDGRTVNGHYWIYYGALSDVQYTITVTDTLTHTTKTYDNPRGRLASRADIGAF